MESWLPKFSGSSVKRASRVENTFKDQIVEAIRISYECASNPSTDHADVCATLVALESVVEAAVNTGGQPEGTTTDKLSVFVSCLKDDSMKERMAAAEGKDKRNVTQSVAQSLRLENVLEKVKKSPLLRNKHIFMIAEPRKDVIVEIAYNAKLPDILWKFYRTCDKDTVINPHFYPLAAFQGRIITPIPPLRDRDTNKNSGEWTEHIVVHGDDTEGRIRLTSEDGTIARLFGAVVRCVVGPLTLFKDIDGHLLSEEDVDQVFMSARNLKCFRWWGSSFKLDPDVKTVQDLINYSGERFFVSSPLSMEPTDFRPPKLRHSTSVMPATWSSGSSHVTQPFDVGTSFSFPVPVPRGPIGSRGISPLHAPSRMVTRPPLQQVPSGPHSIPVAPHYTLPSHPPPTTPEPAKVQNSSPSATPEKARTRVDPVEETLLSIGIIPHRTPPSRRPPTTPDPAKLQNLSPSVTPEKEKTLSMEPTEFHSPRSGRQHKRSDLSGPQESYYVPDAETSHSGRSGPSDQLSNRGLKEVITFQTPKQNKRLCKFLLSSYIQAGDILRKSRRVKWFSFQAIHIARQASHLIIRFNDSIGPDGPTNEQYDEGMDLDDALEELEDKIDELENLDLDEAHRSEEDHKYDLARLYQIFFATRDFYPNGRDYETDSVLKRFVGLDHAALTFARCLQAQGPHIEGVQISDVLDEEVGDNYECYGLRR